MSPGKFQKVSNFYLKKTHWYRAVQLPEPLYVFDVWEEKTTVIFAGRTMYNAQPPTPTHFETDVVYSTGDPWGTSHELHCSKKGWHLKMCEYVCMCEHALVIIIILEFIQRLNLLKVKCSHMLYIELHKFNKT